MNALCLNTIPLKTVKNLFFTYSGDELNESDSFDEADLDDKYIEKSKKVQ